MKTVIVEDAPSLMGFIEYLQGNVWALLFVVPIAVCIGWVLADRGQ